MLNALYCIDSKHFEFSLSNQGEPMVASYDLVIIVVHTRPYGNETATSLALAL
jgi:hypothetical protein